MPVAGTSCVDYSNLNNEKKEIDQGGESGRTFHGMLSWVTNHRPPIVILENVLSAPWPAVKAKMESIGYSAMHRNLDTKQFYIPHTRNRGYLVAVDRARSPVPQKWRDWMGEMQRPASVALDAFLLQSDDPRIHREREKLVQESYVVDYLLGEMDDGRFDGLEEEEEEWWREGRQRNPFPRYDVRRDCSDQLPVSRSALWQEVKEVVWDFWANRCVALGDHRTTPAREPPRRQRLSYVGTIRVRNCTDLETYPWALESTRSGPFASSTVADSRVASQSCAQARHRPRVRRLCVPSSSGRTARWKTVVVEYSSPIRQKVRLARGVRRGAGHSRGWSE